MKRIRILIIIFLVICVLPDMCFADTNEFLYNGTVDEDTLRDLYDSFGWDYDMAEETEWDISYSGSELSGYSDANHDYSDGEDVTVRRESLYGQDYYYDLVATTKLYLGIKDSQSGGAGKIVALALAELALADEEAASGVVNKRIENNGDNNVIYSRYWGGTGSAWCAYFINWLMDQCGYMDGEIWSRVCLGIAGVNSGCGGWLSNNGVTRYKGSELKQFGGSAYSAKPGDIIIYTNSSYSQGMHIGIIVEVGDDYISTVEGNWSNRVSGRTFSSLGELNYQGGCYVYDMTYPGSEVDFTADALVSWLMSNCGYTAAGACGALAIFYNELGICFTSCDVYNNGSEAAGDGGYGICQWTNNARTIFENWMSENGMDRTDLASQLEFYKYYMQTYFPKCYAVLQSTNSATAAGNASGAANGYGSDTTGNSSYGYAIQAGKNAAALYQYYQTYGFGSFESDWGSHLTHARGQAGAYWGAMILTFKG